MALKFFCIPVRQSPQVEEELNGFLSSNRILAVDRRFVDQGDNSFWAVCVDYLAGGRIEGISAFSKKGRVDYRETLPPEEFAVFARLRELRKQLAQAESVPVYTIFTNEQLAEMVQRRATKKSDLEKIGGVGEARIDKYGPPFLSILEAAGLNHEASGKPV